MGAAFGNGALRRGLCKSGITGGERHCVAARHFHRTLCSPKGPHEQWTLVAAALPQVSHEHSTREMSSENGAQTSFKGGTPDDSRLEMDREQQIELDAAGIEQESLQLLDWPAVCAQVACFAATPMAADKITQSSLAMGASQAGSEQLLQETGEALEAHLSLEGVQDIRAMLHALDEGRSLHPLHLTAIASTLLAAKAVEEQLQPKHSALRQVAAGIRGSLPALADRVYQCIHKKDGRILDEASEKLGAIRVQRQENLRARRLAMEEWARELHRKGAAERSQVVVRRNRLCVAIKAGRQSDLPKGSMSLATSSTGSTMYMDPEPTVALNNREAMLSGQEEEEEARILAALSSAVAAQSARIWQILSAIAALDVCMARAGHAAWCGGCRPRFLAPEEAIQHGCVQVGGMRHPLLLQASLDPLPELPSAASEDTELSYLDSFAPGADVPRLAPSGASAAAGTHQARARAPQPVDFWVPAGVSVVTLTGPNTGGKTASLKALGLAAAMSRAGLFLPLQPAAKGAGEPHTPTIAWFDRILADVGDSQNLQESLSTFSGHIKRVRRILGSITRHSLVLLDEVGSGTDPTEGAALAGALLDALASRALLTLATTHHASLKDMAAQDERFCNAGVEFDLKTLRPTYRLTWQSVGASNALAVAEGLGFDPLVIQEARKVAEEASFSVSRTGDRAAALRESLAGELEEARLVVQAAAAARKRAQCDVECLEEDIASLQEEEQTRKAASSPARQKAELAEKQAELDKALHGFRSGALSAEKARQIITQVRASAPQIGAAAFDIHTDSRAPKTPDWEPAPGDSVSLLAMGGSKGQVITGPDARGRYSVKVGKLVLQAQARDMDPLQRQQRTPGSKQKQAVLLHRQGAQKAKAQVESQEPAAMTVQFEHNTRDIRGMRADDVASVVDEAIACNPSGSSIFIVHGMGTGRLRNEVHNALKQHSQIARFELEVNSGGGCTMAVIR